MFLIIPRTQIARVSLPRRHRAEDTLGIAAIRNRHATGLKTKFDSC